MLGKLLGGRYQIVRHLGGGGFGQTYLAEDFHLPGNPQCVVKQLKPKVTDPETLQAARRMFDTEAQVLAKLGSHDQIPQIFAHFEENREFYLVQEFVAGDTLSQELRTRGQFSEAEAISLLQSLLTVLEFVHQQQVVHRDIKPSNLIRRAGDRQPVLIDFGAVKEIGIPQGEGGFNPQATVTIAIGSSGYMPNEQLAGKPRFSSDIYAAGMLTLQCLTGTDPRKLPEDSQTSEILWRDRVAVDPAFADILDTMVRYDYRQRYPSAKEALESLRKITDVAPVVTLLTTPPVENQDGHLIWLERGDELFQQQRYRDAIAAYDHVIQFQPQDYLAWFKRGIALENLLSFSDAAASYDRVVQLQPEDYLAWYKRGNAFGQLQQFAEALESYDQVVRLQPENYWAWQDRGSVLEKLEQFDAAIAAYDRAVRLKPDFSVAIESRKRVLTQLRRVDTLYHLQHYDEAVEACDRSIQQDPTDSLAWLMRGMAQDNLGHYAEAVTAYEQVVALQADDHVAWFKLGTVLEKSDRSEEALAAYYRVVQLQPDNQWAWHDRGRLLEKLNRSQEALSAYDRAVQIQPGFQAASEGRQRMLKQFQSTDEDDDETIVSAGTTERRTQNADLTQVTRQPPLDRSPYPSPIAAEATMVSSQGSRRPTPPPDTVAHPSPQPICSPDLKTARSEETIVSAFPAARVPEAEDYERWMQQGKALEEMQRFPEALAAYRRASKLRLTDPSLWLRQGQLLYHLERYEEAIAAYQKSQALQPDNAEAWYGCGKTQTQLKHYQAAIDCFDLALKIRPQDPNFWYRRGRVLCKLRQYEPAVESFDRAIALNPNFQAARDDRQRVVNQLQRLNLA
jgi:tetratricopeptide (TPR) repeat protein